MALAEERAAREREKYEEEKRREEEIRNSQPKTYTVGIGSGYDFQNLQEAVDASKDTDTIILSPGVYKSTANIGKRITITSGQGTVAAIKSKYFASKDVPVIVLDSGKQSKITADVKISGVVFTGNKSLSFTSFTGYQENSATYDRRYSANVAKSGLKWTKFSEDPMSSSYKSLLRSIRERGLRGCRIRGFFTRRSDAHNRKPQVRQLPFREHDEQRRPGSRKIVREIRFAHDMLHSLRLRHKG